MRKPTLDDYMYILETNPALCIHGMADHMQKNFQANRRSMETSFDAFLLCCKWFQEHGYTGQAEVFSTSSLELKHTIESACGQFIPHGAVLASAIFLDIKLNESGRIKTNDPLAANH